MASRSAAQRMKRKRDSTSQAVDFLNNIHNPADRGSLSSPVRPRRPLRRQTARTTQPSQSDESSGSPQTPEESRSAVSSRIPQSEPVTPRRSKRLHGHPGSESTPKGPIPMVQLDGSANTKSESVHVTVSNDGSDYESGNDSESEESNQDTDKATPQSIMTKNNSRPHEQERNTRRGSANRQPSRSRANGDSTQESEVDESSDESFNESPDDSSDENSDESSDELEPPNKTESHQAQRQSVSEHSLAQLSIKEEPDVSEEDGSDDGSKDGPEDFFQGIPPKLEERSNLTDEDMQDNLEDGFRVKLFTDESDSESDRQSNDFSPSKQLQYEQEMNVGSNRVTENATVPDYGQVVSTNSQGATENATSLSLEEETNVNSQDVLNDTVMSDYEQMTNTRSIEIAEDAAEEEEYVPSGDESASGGSSDAYDPEASEVTPSASASPKRMSLPEGDQRQEPVAQTPFQQKTSSSLQDRASSSDEQNATFASGSITEKPIDEAEVSWFAEAKTLGGQKENWNLLISEAQAASEVVNPSRDHYFREIESSIVSLDKEYAVVVDSLESQLRPTSATLQECERLRCRIGDQGNELLDRIWYRAIKRGDENKLLGGKLAEAFEAHVYYPLVMLIIQCFKAYYHCDLNQLFPRAHDHLLQAMKLLQNLCSRCCALEVTRRVSFRTRGGVLRKKLDALIQALQKGALRNPVSTVAPGSQGKRRRRQPSPRQQVVDVETPPPDEREWTEDEGFALLQGLRRFQGPERYRQILEQFPSRLAGRTVQELRDRTQLLRDTWAPKIAAARTEEQRQKWQFLQV